MAEARTSRRCSTTFGKAWSAYRAGQQRVIQLGRDKKQQDAADIADGASSMAFDEVTGAVNALLALQQQGRRGRGAAAGRPFTARADDAVHSAAAGACCWASRWRR
ncbi:MAG: hypothetical protein MZW92_54180 [Comamonadaceae bacterium]|nr:hypothetical protein [Comamonadaceae bacterium]